MRDPEARDLGRSVPRASGCSPVSATRAHARGEGPCCCAANQPRLSARPAPTQTGCMATSEAMQPAHASLLSRVNGWQCNRCCSGHTVWTPPSSTIGPFIWTGRTRRCDGTQPAAAMRFTQAQFIRRKTAVTHWRHWRARQSNVGWCLTCMATAESGRVIPCHLGPALLKTWRSLACRVGDPTYDAASTWGCPRPLPRARPPAHLTLPTEMRCPAAAGVQERRRGSERL